MSAKILIRKEYTTSINVKTEIYYIDLKKGMEAIYREKTLSKEDPLCTKKNGKRFIAEKRTS